MHALGRYENAGIEKAFLHPLRTFPNADSQPVIVTDAGFISPRFAAVRAIGWNSVGRIRKNRLFRQSNNAQ